MYHYINPKNVTFSPEEIYLINRNYMAKYLGIRLEDVDQMPYVDYCRTLEIMRADQLIAERRAHGK